MEGATNFITKSAENVAELLDIGLETIQTLMSNEYVLIFFSFTLAMWGIKLFHSIRKAI